MIRNEETMSRMSVTWDIIQKTTQKMNHFSYIRKMPDDRLLKHAVFVIVDGSMD